MVRVVVGHHCPNRHELEYIKRHEMPKAYPENSNVYCDNCAGILRTGRMTNPTSDVVEPFTHCAQCRFDLCMDCFTADDERYAALYHTRANVVITIPRYNPVPALMHAPGITSAVWGGSDGEDHWSRCNPAEDYSRDMDSRKAYWGHGPETMARK